MEAIFPGTIPIQPNNAACTMNRILVLNQGF